jgi:hypothetical protein
MTTRNSSRPILAMLLAIGLASACDRSTSTPNNTAVAPAQDASPASTDFAAAFDVSAYVTDAEVGNTGCDSRLMSGTTVRHVADALPDGSVYEVWVRRSAQGALSHIEVLRTWPNEESLTATLANGKVSVTRGTADIGSAPDDSALAATLRRVGAKAEALRCTT